MTAFFSVEPDGLRASSAEVAEVAEAVRGIEPVVTGTLTDGDLIASAVLAPSTALRAEQAILHAVTNADGLGFALGGNTAANLVDGAATALGSEGLAERIATDAIQLRISAVTYEHPELANDERLRRLTELLASDAQLAGAGQLIDLLVGDPNALGDLAPVLPELLALNALLDENPLNDPVGWDILNGRMPSVDPITGLIDLEELSERFDRGPGHAAEIPTPSNIQTSGTPSLQGIVTDIAQLGTDGRIVVRTVVGPDGVTRYIVALPGMNGNQPYPLGHPQDVSGAVHNAYAADSPYTRAVRQAMEQAGVPRGAEVMLVGHSLGGITAANLAQDPTFNGGSYRVTDLVSVGSPVDHKTLPPGSGTSAISITNDRDLVPVLDGQGPGSPYPSAAGRREFEFSTPELGFPASHDAAEYARMLDVENGAPWAREVDASLTPYTRGTIVGTTTYQLSDSPPDR